MVHVRRRHGDDDHPTVPQPLDVSVAADGEEHVAPLKLVVEGQLWNQRARQAAALREEELA